MAARGEAGVSKFVKVAGVGDIASGVCKKVVVDGQPVALYNVEGEFYATDDTCSHAEASLSEGELDGHEAICPLHGARFDVRTGRALSLPAVMPIDTYIVRVEGNDVLVSLEA